MSKQLIRGRTVFQSLFPCSPSTVASPIKRRATMSILETLTKEKKLALWRYLSKRAGKFTDKESKAWRVLAQDPDIDKHIKESLTRVIECLGKKTKGR